MTDYHIVEVQTITRTFSVTAETQDEARTKAKTLDGAFDISEYKEHSPNFDVTGWTKTKQNETDR